MLGDKAIIVTGAGSGIGRATTLILARHGAKLLVADLNRDAAEETARLVESEGGVAHPMRVDVTCESDIKAMVDCAVETFGYLNGAFNNAGLPMQNKLVEELDAIDWDRVMDVNLRGVFLCMKYEILAMRNHGGGGPL